MHAKWKSSTSPLPTAESNDPRQGRSQLRIHAFPSRRLLFVGTPVWHRGRVPRSRGGALCPRDSPTSKGCRPADTCVGRKMEMKVLLWSGSFSMEQAVVDQLAVMAE